MLAFLAALPLTGLALAGPCSSGVSAWYRDADGDGYGVPPTRLFCNDYPHPGWVPVSGDCDDAHAEAHPGATEVCDGLDDDCDGVIDGPDAEGAALWYRDADGDGVGVDSPTVTACDQPDGFAATTGDCDDADPDHASTCPTPERWVVYWGDVHAHTNLSKDGCEDETDWCRPRETYPGEDFYTQAAAVGLDFAGLADHSEYRRYVRAADGVDLDIWAQEQAWVVAAEGGPALPVLGYEFTAAYGHRTVVLDTTTACSEYRKAGGAARSGSKGGLGYEVYKAAATSGYTTSAEFEAGMLAAEASTACSPTRWLSWFHHPAYRSPAKVDWTLESNRLATDRVVEIASEHGVSECADRAWPGCEYRINTGFDGTGSVQTALQLGYRLGFVGGTDTHDGRPGSVADGPSYVGEFTDTDGDGVVDTPRRQFTDGALTGVLLPEGRALTRAGLFEALEARHTFAATWPFAGLMVTATAADGTVYLPGDDVPAGAGPLVVTVALDDPEVTSWYAERIDPDDGSASMLDAGATIGLGDDDVVYVRIRAWIDGDEHRAWASPWFGE